MALPVTHFNWNGILVNQRVTYTSLLATMGGVITGHTNNMIARGFVCAGSSDGTAGGMDGVNRCTTAAGFAVRGSSAGVPHSWIVLTHANGSQTCFDYGGTGDDIARVAFSAGGLYVAAATPTQQPTATDEIVQSYTSLIGVTASLDRVYTSWVDSTYNAWRLAVFRQGMVVGNAVGAEPFDASPLVGITCEKNMWGHATSGSYLQMDPTSSFSASNSGGMCRTSGHPYTALGGYTVAVNGNTGTGMNNAILTANGGLKPILSVGLWSNTAGATGLIGFRYDWYKSCDQQVCGTLTPGMEWVGLTDNGGSSNLTLWPWDGVTAVCVTS